jgi:diguanylate cyclase (GGDEF)-like protein
MSIRSKANIATGVVLAALAGLGWLSLRENQDLAQADRWVSHTHEVLETVSSMRAHFVDAGIARRMFLQGNGKQIETLNATGDAVLADFNRLKSETADNAAQQRRLALLEPVIEQRIALLKKSVSIHSENASDESLQRDFTDQLTIAGARFAQQSREFEDVEKELLRQRSRQADEIVRGTAKIDTVLSVFVFCFIVVAVALLNRELLRRKQIERMLANQKSLLQSILDTCSDAIVVADNTGTIILRNPAGLLLSTKGHDRLTPDSPKQLGYYQADEVTPLPYRLLPLRRALLGERIDNFEICMKRPGDGSIRWTLASSRPLLDENAEARGGVVFYRDISERKELEKQLTRSAEELKRSNLDLQNAQTALQLLASTDELTGLYNRRGFLALAEQNRKLARRSRKPFALAFVDLDGLKAINDSLGHEAGNRAIVDAAFVLRDSFRQCDVLGRLGGDEFAVLMIDSDEKSTEIVRKRIADKVEKLNRECNRPYRLSLSVGMLWCAFDEESNFEALLARVDELMYEEKKKKNAGRSSEGAHQAEASEPEMHLPDAQRNCAASFRPMSLS